MLHIALLGITSLKPLQPSAFPPSESIKLPPANHGTTSWSNSWSERAGVECLAGIPGTVGGTPVQNVGAYGQEVASVIDRVRTYDLLERDFIEFNAAGCAFSYRRAALTPPTAAAI